MDLNRLRQETAPEHESTESIVPLTSETLTRAQYVDVLRRFYRVVRAWDLWVDAHQPADLQPLMQGRRRAVLLANDLQALDEAVPGDEDLPSLEAPGLLPESLRSLTLGRMYVVEGSTLGGQVIARHVESRFGLQHGVGNAYFVGYGEDTGRRWREFKAVLAELPESESDPVIASAKGMFRHFRDAMLETHSAGAGRVPAMSTGTPDRDAERQKGSIEYQ